MRSVYVHYLVRLMSPQYTECRGGVAVGTEGRPSWQVFGE